jgi:hypothetical protein
LISGGDPIAMIKDIYREELGQINENKFMLALKNIGKMWGNKKFNPLLKRKILKQIRLAGLKHKEAKSLGLKSSKHLWKACMSDQYEKRGRKY